MSDLEMTLGERMKQYEAVYDYALPTKVPLIVRIDGKRFSNFVKKIKAARPFDHHFTNAMVQSTLVLCDEVDGCVVGYTQSDEITLVIRNDQSENTEPWFGNRLQKIISVSSSVVTAHFNLAIREHFEAPVALFDCRAFVVPDAQEALNVLVWRQNDCIKNSISCACYHEVSVPSGRKTAQKMMYGLNQAEQLKLLEKVGVDWHNYADRYKYGVAVYKVQSGDRSTWYEDEHLPIFAKTQDFLRGIVGVGK